MNVPFWYYIVILGAIGGCVAFLLHIKKKNQAASDAKRPPQRGIIK